MTSRVNCVESPEISRWKFSNRSRDILPPGLYSSTETNIFRTHVKDQAFEEGNAWEIEITHRDIFPCLYIALKDGQV